MPEPTVIVRLTPTEASMLVDMLNVHTTVGVNQCHVNGPGARVARMLQQIINAARRSEVRDRVQAEVASNNARR
jgi:hypothetical protein